MPRKKTIRNLTPADVFDDMVIEAIWNTTIEMRADIAKRFENGDVTGLLVEINGVTREALLIASLVDAESRLVFAGNKLREKRLIDLLKPLSKLHHFKATLDRTRIIQSFAQVSHRTVEKTVKKVENSSIPVEKSVESYVEKSGFPVENFEPIYAFPKMGDKFSTSVEKTADLSTGLRITFPAESQLEGSLFKDSQPAEIPAKFSTLSTGPTTTTDSTHI